MITAPKSTFPPPTKHKAQSLELTHLKYDPSPFLVFLVSLLTLLVSVVLSSYIRGILFYFFNIMMCHFIYKEKGDTYLYFKSLVVHTISIKVGYVSELDTIGFR